MDNGMINVVLFFAVARAPVTVSVWVVVMGWLIVTIRQGMTHSQPTSRRSCV